MKKNIIIIVIIFCFCGQLFAQKPKISRPKTPIMGWASWNNFRNKINEQIIKSQTDAVVSKGLKKVGYNFVNIDDGYFGGRDENGNLFAHKERFPKGMKEIADYIHSKGMKAGIYSDAGINTCASYWDKDPNGVGVGLFGHDEKDLDLMLNQWGFDFVKVDWCGGEWLGLDEQTRYTQIGNLIRQLKPSAVYNICRWKFPGNWATSVADSWRISGDIANKFSSVMKIIDLNADLWRHSQPGHVNDMDMLQVGRGMSQEEDKTHFSMWCMMNSPLLLGNDLTKMSPQTLEIITNTEIIALNQDPLVYQARRLVDNGDLEIWAKPLVSTMSGKVAVALLNRSEKTEKITLLIEKIGIEETQGYAIRDLWQKKNYPISQAKEVEFEVPTHGVVVLKIVGKMKPYNIFQLEKPLPPR